MITTRDKIMARWVKKRKCCKGHGCISRSPIKIAQAHLFSPNSKSHREKISFSLVTSETKRKTNKSQQSAPWIPPAKQRHTFCSFYALRRFALKIASSVLFITMSWTAGCCPTRIFAHMRIILRRWQAQKFLELYVLSGQFYKTWLKIS